MYFETYNLGGTKFFDSSIVCDKLLSIIFLCKLGESCIEGIDPLRVDDDSAYKLNEFEFFGEVPSGDTPYILSFGIKVMEKRKKERENRRWEKCPFLYVLSHRKSSATS